MTSALLSKPAYAVPSMRSVEAVEWNGLNVISTFSGAGGSSLGFRMAGFRVRAASEFVAAARETYAANSSTPIDPRDIREVTGDELRALAGLADVDVDVLEGSPPCSSFSTAGLMDDKWGLVTSYSETAQRSDDLFFEFARLVREIRPRVFVAENVSGLVRGVSIGYFKLILRALTAAGYNVRAQLVNAQWLGVPQDRNRIIFVGSRLDQEREPVFPKPLPYRYSLTDALATLDAPTRSELLDATLQESYAKLWPTLKPGQAHKQRFNLRRSHPNRPVSTVVAVGGVRANVTHHAEPRRFTIRELKRITSFPDDFELTGSYAKQWERLGRSVPPLMMRAIASSVAEMLA